jgi:hypothetical protein
MADGPPGITTHFTAMLLAVSGIWHGFGFNKTLRLFQFLDVVLVKTRGFRKNRSDFDG